MSVNLLKNTISLQATLTAKKGSFIITDTPTHSVVSYGINSYTANTCPLVIFYDDNSVQLFEDPYIAKNYDRNGKLYNYYMEPGGSHYVSSVERFEKYLIEGIKYQTETYNRLTFLNNKLCFVTNLNHFLNL